MNDLPGVRALSDSALATQDMPLFSVEQMVGNGWQPAPWSGFGAGSTLRFDVSLRQGWQQIRVSGIEVLLEINEQLRSASLAQLRGSFEGVGPTRFAILNPKIRADAVYVPIGISSPDVTPSWRASGLATTLQVGGHRRVFGTPLSARDLGDEIAQVVEFPLLGKRFGTESELARQRAVLNVPSMAVRTDQEFIIRSFECD